MSRFDDTFKQFGLPRLMETFGSLVTYTTAAGEELQDITAYVGPISDEVLSSEDGRTQYRQRTVKVRLQDVENPGYKDVVTIDEVDWIFHSTVSQQAGQASIRVVRPVQVEVTPANYRA